MKKKTYKTIFFIVTKDQSEDIKVIKNTLFPWVQSLHDQNCPVYGVAKLNGNSVIFFIESYISLSEEFRNTINTLISTAGYTTDSVLIVPPA